MPRLPPVGRAQWLRLQMMRPASDRRDGKNQRGAAIVELSIVLAVLLMLIFSAVDIGRTAQVQNRMHSSARAGAEVAQFSPMSVDSGCRGGRNIVDRSIDQDRSLTKMDGYSVSVAKKDIASGAMTTYTGCGSTTPSVGIQPGDHLVVTVTAKVSMSGPISAAVVGNVMDLTRRIEIVVQG